MKIRDLFKRALFLVSVPKCVCCNSRIDYNDRGLCKDCYKIYLRHKERNCPHCSKILSECSCAYDVLKSHGISKLVKLFRYSKTDESMPSNYLIYSLKQDNRSDVISFLCDELSLAISKSFDVTNSNLLITNVPRRRKAIVNFGYDHAKVLAQGVAERLGIEYAELLKSKSKKSQKSVYGQDRITNANFDYKVRNGITLKGKHVIIIDDIVTTGASMRNCATLIRGLGTRRIYGACLGTAYKEPYIDYNKSASK